MPACTRCNGKGSIGCPECGGRGTAEEGQLELLMEPPRGAPHCPACNGTGSIPCPVCDGSGATEDDNDD
jgi:DnaJ-class molecular chaperone